MKWWNKGIMADIRGFCRATKTRTTMARGVINGRDGYLAVANYRNISAWIQWFMRFTQRI
jgi:hypothetical protein